MSVDDLIFPRITKKQIEAEQKTHYMKDKIPLDWQTYDDETAPILEQLVRDIYDGTASEIGRPERVSERLIYRELALSAHRLENMPKCRQIFERYTESYPESWARKIIWAYGILKKEKNTHFYWSDIRELSGVKKKNFVAIIPYLIKHTDKRTADKIKALVGGENCM